MDSVHFYDNNFFVHEARTADFAERIALANRLPDPAALANYDFAGHER